MPKLTRLSVLALTCLSSSCGLASTADVSDRCTGPVSVTVAPAELPTISWMPRCSADYVAVGYAGLNDVWWVYRLTGPGILPDVRVGDSPPGTRTESSLSLIHGTEYSVSVGWRTVDSGAFKLGSWGSARFVY